MAKLPFALQLYSVREALEDHIEGTLERVKAAGYNHVETAGTAGLSAAAFNAALRHAGLEAISAHVAFEACRADIASVIEDCRVLGVSWAVIPWLSAEDNKTAADWAARGRDLAGFSAAFKSAGIQLCYHNHTQEFEQFDGRTALEIIFESAGNENLELELDAGWAHYAGADPVALVKRHAGHVPLIHIKDVKARVEGEPPVVTELGNGATKFAPVFKAAGESGTQWLIVEQDESARDPLESARMNAAYMRVHVY